MVTQLVPQQMFMAIAMFLAQVKKISNKSKDFYDVVSKFEVMLQLQHYQMLEQTDTNYSCYIGSTPDNIEGFDLSRNGITI